MKIREGTLAEAIAIEGQIGEFHAKKDLETYQRRTADRPTLVIITEIDGKAVGYHVGYGKDKSGVFYSLRGGLLKKYRGSRVAEEVLGKIEGKVREYGYRKIRIKSRNRFVGMIITLFRRGFHIAKLEEQHDPAEYVVILEKSLNGAS